MHKGGRGYEGKGAGRNFDRGGGNGWYRNDYRDDAPEPPPQNRDRDERGFAGSKGGRGGHRDRDERHADGAAEPAAKTGNGDELAEVVVSRLEKHLTSVHKEFMTALHQKSQKENDKFDLIFGILSELQSRQGHLEDLVGNLTAQHQGNGMASSSMAGMSMGNGMAQQFGNGSGMPQHYGQMGGMGVQPMQQYGGMMNPDGSQGMVAMQQVMVVQSPTGGAMVPQMQMQPGMGQGGQQTGSFTQEQVAAPGRGTLGALELASTPSAPDTAVTSLGYTSPSAAERESSSATASQGKPSPRSTFQEPAHELAGSSPSKAWDKVRRWQATIPEDERVPVVTCSEPFGPGIGRDAPEDIVVKWLKNGDVVRQTDHSKKMKGYMVMPVKVEASNPFEVEVEGFVTRRSIEKNRDNGDVVWFEEVEGRS